MGFLARCRATLAELDASNAADVEYRDVFSSGSRALHPYRTWRAKLVATIARLTPA